MTSPFLYMHRRLRAQRLRWLILGLAVAGGLIGYYGPWAPHKAAGLIVIGLDLAEYVKFLPDIIAGRIVLHRELFYLPLFAASVTASLISGRRAAAPPWARAGLAAASIPCAAAMLPPAWSPASLQLPEFRVQMVAIFVCWLLVPGALLTRFLPDRLILAIIALLCLAAALAPAWGFLQIHPGIEALYRQALPLGWGFWLNTAGFGSGALYACAEMLRND